MQVFFFQQGPHILFPDWVFAAHLIRPPPPVLINCCSSGGPGNESGQQGLVPADCSAGSQSITLICDLRALLMSRLSGVRCFVMGLYLPVGVSTSGLLNIYSNLVVFSGFISINPAFKTN